MYQQSDLIYTDSDHTYRLPVPSGRIPGVTETLAGMGFISDFAISKRASEFGTNVHSVIDLDVHGVLDVKSLSEGLINPYHGWKKFRSDYSFLHPIIEWVEKPMFHPLYLYGMRPDLPMYSISKSGKKEYWIIDIKTSTAKYQDHWELQTAAYELALCEVMQLPVSQRWKRRVLWLTDKDQTYELVPLTDPAAYCTWTGVLNGYWWKIRKKNLYGRGNTESEQEFDDSI